MKDLDILSEYSSISTYKFRLINDHFISTISMRTIQLLNTPLSTVKQESCAIAKMTARCALY